MSKHSLMDNKDHQTSFFITQDGSHSLHSEKFGVYYHSTHGAIQETEHVFIKSH